MSRLKGLLQISGNFEPQIAGPFDGRSICDTYADLILPATWEAKDGTIYTYVGMRVNVTSDIDPLRNGVYYLNTANYQLYASWVKLGDGAATASLSTRSYPLTGKTIEIDAATHLFAHIASHEVINSTTKIPVFVTNYMSSTNSIIIESLVDLTGYESVMRGW